MRRKVNGKVLTGLFLLFVIAMAIFCARQAWKSDYVQKKYVFEWPYSREIFLYSAKSRLDPFLVVSVIKNESGFNPEARSKIGAMGLMQIMPETGTWIARTTDFPNFRDRLLFLPELNIKFGCWYLGELEHEFQGNEFLILAAYNAGRGTVKSWMEENKWDYDFKDISKIPFDDTRKYVQKVLADRKEYKRLYKNFKVEP